MLRLAILRYERFNTPVHCIADLVLEIQQTVAGIGSRHQADLYFPPVRVVPGRVSCLTMNFTASSYFAVKLLYTNNGTYHEKLIFRSLSPLGSDFLFWQKSISAELTASNEYVVVLQARSVGLGTLAVIKRFELIPGDCTSGNAGTPSLRPHTQTVHRDLSYHID